MARDVLASWLMDHSAVLWVLGAGSLVMFVGTIVALPLIIIYLPAQSFNPSKHSLGRLSTPRLILLALKNILGMLLVGAGLIMLVLPGQGLVTLLIGLLLINFPGKRRLICRLLQQPRIISSINRIRAAANRPPVTPPQPLCPGEYD